MERQPLVTCIMPTRNRRRFVPLAVRHFLRQDYEPRELLVLDDGDDPVADLMPRDERIRYVRLDRRHSVGAKRNIACRLARGDVIVHWDDDDWMADWRLSYQVAQLLASGVGVCGLDRLLFLDAAADQAWQYVYPRSGKPWLAGGTLCYRRELWQRNPFPDLDVGEDNRFVWSGAAKRLLALPDNTFYVAMIHDGNTSPKRTHGLRWQPHPVEPLRKMLGSEWVAYAGGDASAALSMTGGDAAAALSMTGALPLTINRSPLTIDHSPAITVSLPYYTCRRTLLRAVDSILAQTHTNLTLVVVNDGDPSPPWDLLAHIDDPRLVRYDLSVNRGRYFVDAVILAATPDPYLLIQDADDWSEPERVAALLQSCQLSESWQLSGAVSACRLWREGSRAGQLLTYPGLRRPLSERFEFRSDHHGLFSTEALRRIGGNYGGYRIGYDTLLINLLCMTGELAYVDRPLYNRQIRANSLTTSQTTGMRSATRRKVRSELAELYAAALQLRRNRAADELPAAIRSLVEARVTDRERAEIQAHAAALRELILASQSRRPDTVRAGSNGAGQAANERQRVETQLRQLLHDPRLPWSSWTVTPGLAQRLAGHLCQQRPQRILETGSGLTTALLARYAELTGAEVIALEHEPRFYRQTAALLERLHLRRMVDLRLAPLGVLRRDGCGPLRWYSPLPEGKSDFIFVDGPPQQVGREGALFALADRLNPDGELWLHNGHRAHEQACLAAWQSVFSFDASLLDVDKGVWILRHIQPLERWSQPVNTASIPS